MRILVTADWHLSSYKSTYFDVNTHQGAALSKLAEYINQLQPDMVVVAGDIFNDKVYVYMNAYNVLDEFFSQISSYLQTHPFYFIAGNHDLGRHGCLLHVMDQITQIYPTVHIICNGLSKVDNNILLAPYSSVGFTSHQSSETARERFEEFVEEIKSGNEYILLLSHFGLNEARLNNGVSKIDPIRLKSLLPIPVVVLGHYHTPQTITRTNSKINKIEQCACYVGSLAAKDWNDKNEIKRCIIVDTSKITDLYNNRLDASFDPETFIESYPLRSRDIFEFKEYMIDGNTINFTQMIDKIINRQKPNYITRVVITGKPEDVEPDVFQNALDSLRDRGIYIISAIDKVANITGSNDDEEESSNKWLGKDLNQLCEQYAQLHADSEALLEVLQEINQQERSFAK